MKWTAENKDNYKKKDNPKNADNIKNEDNIIIFSILLYFRTINTDENYKV